MKFRLLILIILLPGSFTAAFAQNDSVPTIVLQRIKDNGRVKQKIIKPFHHANIITSSRKYYPDSLKLFNGQALLAEKDTIAFSDIQKLRVHDPNHATKTAEGVLLSFAGAGTIFTGVLAIGMYGATQGEKDEFKTWGILYCVAGVILVPAGLILAFSNRTFDTRDKWKIVGGYYQGRKHRP